MTRSRAAVFLLGLVSGLLLTAVLVVTIRTAFSFTDVGERLLSESCMDTPASADGAGVCVRRVERTELIVLPGRHEVRVFRTRDGAITGGRYLVMDDPFAGSDPERVSVRVTPAGDVEVHNDGSIRLVFGADAVAGLTT